MPAAPRKGKRLGGSASHQKAILANLIKSMCERGYLDTTVTRAKFLRPTMEKMITKAIDGDVHSQRIIRSFVRDRATVYRLVHEIGPRMKGRSGGYLRITKIGFREGDKAPLARIEFVA